MSIDAVAILFWTAVFLAAALTPLVRDVHEDDPRRSATHEPPRSHHEDPFALTGSSFH